MVSSLKLLEVIEEFKDLEMGPDFSNSIVLVVLSSLTYMKLRHFIISSESLFGCQFWMFSSTCVGIGRDFGGSSEQIPGLRSFSWKKKTLIGW